MLKLKKVKGIESNEAYQKVMHWFFAFPDGVFGLSTLALALGLAKTTTNKVVIRLEKEKFLHIEVIGRTWRIRCNKSHHYNFGRKVAYNLTLISDSDIVEKIHEIEESPRAIVLFGSYRKGDDVEGSDLDIAVEVISKKRQETLQIGVIPRLGYRKNVKVQVQRFSRKNVDPNVFANIANGIVLEGFLEAKP